MTAQSSFEQTPTQCWSTCIAGEIRAESEVVVVLEWMKEEVGVLCKLGAQSVKGKGWIKRNTMEDYLTRVVTQCRRGEELQILRS